MPQDLKRTPLYETHLSLNGRMVPFAGWDMPVQFGSILKEAGAVRASSGLFDVSHMGRLYISGAQATQLLDWVLTANVSDLGRWRARYAMVCNEMGGIIDDTVFYRLGEQSYLLVCNAGNRPYVVSWLHTWADNKFPDTVIEDRTESTAMIAFQGPRAASILEQVCDSNPSKMRFFSAQEGSVASKPALIGRTGYTGEDGFELILEAQDAAEMWKALMDLGAVPCGLGARDVLRLEAGLALHGHDISPETTPLEAGLERFVQMDKGFVGVEALRQQQQNGLQRRLIGLVLEGRNIAREGYSVQSNSNQVGSITSGTHSPTLDRNIAMAYVLLEFSGPENTLSVDIRGKSVSAQVVTLPFYTRKAAA